MSIARTVIFLIFIVHFCTVIARAGEIDTISRSVVFLSDNKPVIEVENGVPYEVWLKNPTNNSFIIKKTTVSGSGLIVVSSNIAYLVTAKHVALEMSQDCEMIMGGDKEEPLHFTLSSITGQPSSLLKNWQKG
jgi:hypothetical protein